MKRFIGLFVVFTLVVAFFSTGLTDISSKTSKHDDFINLAKEEIEKGNFDKAKAYIERCFKLSQYEKEAKELYSKIKNKERKHGKAKATVKKLKSPMKRVKTPVKEVKIPNKKQKNPIKKINVPVDMFLKNKDKVQEREWVETIPAVQKNKSSGKPRATLLWEDFEGSWGPYGDDPPAGWTILDYGDESPSEWNNNDWHNYTYGGTQGQVARVYYSPIENQDEWLITPQINIPAETCSLKFWNYFSQYSTTDTGYVLGSIDNGSNWTDTIAVYTTDISGVDEAYDITSWAIGQSQVKIAFNYKGNDDLYWYVDECSVATYVTYQYDVGVTEIIRPPDSVSQRRRTWSPRAVIKNFGNDNVRYFWVYCNIESNNTYKDSIYISSWMNQGDVDTLTFSSWDPQVTGTDTMAVCHDGNFDGNIDEYRANDTLSNSVKIVQSYFTGGPDAYGYSWIDSDITGGPTYSWIPENGGTAIGFASADESVKVALPFNFMFYENVYDSIYICSNGYVSFGAGYTAYSNGSIPSGATPNNAIYAFWDDLNPSPTGGGDVYYKSIANGFVVIWKDVPHYSNVGAASFEVILYDNGSIVLQYEDVNFEDGSYNFGMSATVGIENSDGSTGLEYEFDGSPYGNLIFSGRAIEFDCERDSYDVAISAIPKPLDSVPQGRKIWAPRAVLTNFGTEDVIDFDVVCSFKSNNIYVDTFPVSSWFNSFDNLVIDFSDWNPQIIGTDTMTVYHNLTNDEDRSNDTLSKPVKIVRSYFTGGPDAYGYSWIDSDTTGGPPYSWIGTNGGTALGLGDDSNVKVELPFPFRYYETVYDSIYICSNGFVGFENNTSLSNGSIPNSGTPNNAIYGYWDDLDPTEGGEIYYKTLSGPDRFVIIWDDVYHNSLSCTQGISFEIILYDNGGIVLQYNDVNFGNSTYNYGRSATVGIENADGSTGLEYQYEWDPYGNLILPQRAIDFPCDDKPSPPIIYPLYIDADGNFDVYWTPSIDRDGIAAYQLDEVKPDTLLYDSANANGVFDLYGFSRSNAQSHSPTRSYGSSNVSNALDSMISTSSYLGAQSVNFWWWGGCETNYDYGYFDISTDNGTSWINLGTYNGDDKTWYNEVVDVSSYSGYPILLKFKYDSDGSNDYGGFWVDDILLSGWTWVETLSSSIPDTTYYVTGAATGQWHYYHAKGKDNLDNWGSWGNVEDIWVGPNDTPSITVLKPAEDTFIVNPANYTIKWIDSDPDNNAEISLYYDTDNTGYDGILIQDSISEDDPEDSLVWDMSSIYGTYYIYGKIDDGINAPAYSYSNGTVSHLDLPAPPTDGLAISNNWLYFTVDPSESGNFLQDRNASNVLIYTVLGDTSVTSDDGVKLLFGTTTPHTSGTTIRINGNDLVMGDTIDGVITSPIHYIAGSGPTEQQTGGNDGISYTMRFGPIEVKQDALLATGMASYGHFDQCLLRYTAVNISGDTHEVGIRIHFDTMLDTEDGALIRVAGYPYSVLQRLYDGSGSKPIPWYYWAKDSLELHPVATTVSMGILKDYGQATCPDSFCVAHWPDVSDSTWNYPYNPNDTISDSDVIMWYSSRLLQPGDTMVVATYYGSGPFNEDIPTAISLSEFNASYFPKEKHINVFWRTQNEKDNLGFNVYRSIEEGEYEKLNKDIIEGAGNSSSPKEYSFIDNDIKEVGNYHYKLEQVDLDGTSSTYGPVSVNIRDFIPVVSSLHRVAPNPFTSHSTTIPFVVGLQDGENKVSIKIYNVSGRVIKTLIDTELEPGFYEQRWNTTDNNGKKVSSGVYYTVLKTENSRKVKKLVLIK
jgi:hypothetical protein